MGAGLQPSGLDPDHSGWLLCCASDIIAAVDGAFVTCCLHTEWHTWNIGHIWPGFFKMTLFGRVMSFFNKKTKSQNKLWPAECDLFHVCPVIL